MNFNIGDQYRIESDELNIKMSAIVLKEKDGEPTGETGLKFVGYYKNLEHAFRAIVDREIRTSDAENMAELVKIIYDAKREIVNAANKLEEALRNG